MKTLIFNGSPRPEGDTAGLLRLLTPRLPGEVLRVDAYRCGVSPCVDCRFCWTHPGCAIQDEMQEIYEIIRSCDGIIIASPVYFSELPGKLLDVASRLQTFFCARAFRGETPIPKAKRGAVILVGGGDGSMDRAHATARILLHQMNCDQIHPLVSSHATNRRPAAEDPQALAGLDSVVRFFREGVLPEEPILP